jgi:tetratricopeptide (TPR) repeat protein
MKLVDPSSNSLFQSTPSKLPNFLARYLAHADKKRARRAARRQDWSAAADFYLKALRLTPGDGRSWVQLGHAYGHLMLPQAADRAYLNATQAQPGYAAGHRHLGHVRRGTHLHKSGIASLARALLLDPTDRETAEIIHTESGDTGIEANLYKAALSHADQGRSKRPLSLRANGIRSKARRAARRRDWKLAESLYSALTRLEPSDPDAHLQLGHALNEQNRQTEAELAYRRAIACDPLYADPWLHLGYVLTAQNQHGAAREAFAAVLQIAPDRIEDHPILADLLGAQQAALAHPSTASNMQAFQQPHHLSDREGEIWNLLATHIQGRR